MTPEELMACTGCTKVATAEAWLPEIELAMNAYDINTTQRRAAFLAQIGHESGGLHYTTEIWGPTPTQARYEGREDLGNTQPGDGSRFRGHGLIQVTGRTNHAAARDRLQAKFPGMNVPDFELQPEALAQMRWAALSAADFWAAHGLNELADAGDFARITRRINGGLNGEAERVALYGAAMGVLA